MKLTTRAFMPISGDLTQVVELVCESPEEEAVLSALPDEHFGSIFAVKDGDRQLLRFFVPVAPRERN